MKSFTLLPLLSAVSFAALAQTSVNTETITIKPNQLTLHGNIETRVMDNSDFYRFVRSYELANGQTLSLISRGFQQYAAIEGGAWHQIHPTSANSFIADDRKLAIQINFDGDGAASGYAILAPGSTNIAGSTPVNSEITVAFKQSPMKKSLLD